MIKMRTFTYSGSLDIIAHDYNDIDSDEFPKEISKLIHNYETIIARKQISKDKYLSLRLDRFDRTPNLFSITDYYIKIVDKYNLMVRKDKLEKIK